MKRRRPAFRTLLVLCFGLTFCAGGLADSEPAGGDSDGSPAYGQAAEAVAAEDYVAAIALLEVIVGADESHADALNLLGFSHRKLGALERAKRYYDRALAVDPNHVGANEYLGELYLEIGDVAAAEQRLTVLEGACGATCEAYLELKGQIEQREVNRTN